MASPLGSQLPGSFTTNYKYWKDMPCVQHTVSDYPAPQLNSTTVHHSRIYSTILNSFATNSSKDASKFIILYFSIPCMPPLHPNLKLRYYQLRSPYSSPSTAIPYHQITLTKISSALTIVPTLLLS